MTILPYEQSINIKNFKENDPKIDQEEEVVDFVKFGTNQLVLLGKIKLSIVKKTLHTVTTEYHHLTHVSPQILYLKLAIVKSNSLLTKYNLAHLFITTRSHLS